MDNQEVEPLSIAEYDALRQVDGFFVGSLTDEELALLGRPVATGMARRVYQGTAGILGVAKVQIVRTPK